MSLVKIVNWFGNSGISPDTAGLMLIGDSIRWDYNNYCIELNSDKNTEWNSNYISTSIPHSKENFKYRVVLSYYNPDQQDDLWGDGFSIGCMGNSTPITNKLAAWSLYHGGYYGYDGSYVAYLCEKQQKDMQEGQLSFFTNGNYYNSSESVGYVSANLFNPLIIEGGVDENSMHCTVLNNSGKLLSGSCGLTQRHLRKPFGGKFFFINGVNKTYNTVRRVHSIEVWTD